MDFYNVCTIQNSYPFRSPTSAMNGYTWSKVACVTFISTIVIGSIVLNVNLGDGLKVSPRLKCDRIV